MRHTRHKSVAIMRRYDRRSGLWVDNAGAQLGPPLRPSSQARGNRVTRPPARTGAFGPDERARTLTAWAATFLTMAQTELRRATFGVELLEETRHGCTVCESFLLVL
jgi:hypothetical protein